jgi:hypothetical protein
MYKKFNEWLSERQFADTYGKWKFVELTPADIEEWSEDLTNLVQTAYKQIGGAGEEFESGEKLRKSDITFWIASDIDADPEIDATAGGKSTKNGIKLTVIGQDGSNIAKKEILTKITALMRTNGYYAELDPALALKLGVSYIKDENVIKQIIGTKHQFKMNPDGSYERKIQGLGKTKTKVLVGMPKV